MKVTTKGQVTIPQWLRDKYGINVNTEVEFIEKNGKVYIEKKKPKDGESVFAKLRGTMKSEMTTEEIMKLTRGKD